MILCKPSIIKKNMQTHIDEVNDNIIESLERLTS